MTMASPVVASWTSFAVAFWLSVGGTVLHQSGRNSEMFLAGFFLSVITWALALPAAIAVAHQILQGRGQGWISSTCGPALIVFGCILGRANIAPRKPASI